MQQLQIPFASQITLKSKLTQKYLGFKYQPETIHAHFPHPCIHTNLKPGQPIDMALKLKIVPREPEKAQDKTLPVFEGARVYLVNASTEQFLTSTSKGQLKFDKKSMNDQMNKMLFKSATWTLSYASAQKTLTSPSRTPITPFDLIVLKSVYGTYLTVHPNSYLCQAVLQMDEERSVWYIELAQSLQLPQWLYNRPSFSKYLTEPQASQMSVVERRSLRSQPPELQQALLVEDILDVSLGFEGSYIKRRPGSNLFVIEPHLQTTSNGSIGLHQLTYRILQITSHYEKLMAFAKKLQFSQGVLVQALGDGLRKIIAQYYQQIVQLDELAAQGLSLQKMWVEVQDSLKVMKALGELVNAAKDLRGGQLLSCLQKLINQTTDGFVLNIYKHILERLVTIYVGMLSKWIYEGLIDDRYGEFMVKTEERSQGEWNSWQQRFTLRGEQVPVLLQRDQQKILVTGKYLNILKACSRQTHCPFAKDIEQNIDYHISRQNFTEPIQRAYEWANKQLLQLVFTECKLMEVLNSLKGYYFLRFGDLFVHFLDAAQEDLFAQKKPKNDNKARPFSVQKLQSLFDLNVRTSSAASDCCKEQVSCRLDTATIFQQVHRIKTLQSDVFQFDFSQKPFLKKDSRYIDFVTLDFKCQFPLNLILNKKSLSKYQALFRLMIWCKFMERQLGSCWVKLQGMKEMETMDSFKYAYSINHRILTFVKSLIYYFSEEVVEQNWFKLSTDLKKVQNFEEIIQCHDRFLNNCLKQALLTNAKLLPLLTTDIGSTIYNYVALKNYLAKIQDQYNTIKEQGNKPKKPNELKDYMRHIRSTINQFMEEQSFKDFLTGSFKSFQEGINTFVRQISLSTKKEQNHLLRLSEMLDQQNFIPHRGRMLYQ